MTANPEIVFNNMAYGRIKGGISASATEIELYPGDVQLFLPQWASGKIMYLTITDSQNHIEVVKVTGISGQKLTASRGQDGTVAIQWYDGAIINQRMPVALLDACIQKEAPRQVAFNPNGVLSPAYRGEKVYRTLTKTWYKNISGTDWQRITAETPLSIGLEYVATYSDLGTLSWAAVTDGVYVYLAAGVSGVGVYEIIGETLSLIDSDDLGGNFRGIAIRDSIIITGNQTRGLDTYGFDSISGITPIDNDATVTGGYNLYDDGTFIFMGYTGGIASYSVSAGGVISFLDSDNPGGSNYGYGIDGDGTFIYLAKSNDGLHSYTRNGSGVLTKLDSDDLGGDYRDVACNGGFIFAGIAVDGTNSRIDVYTVDGVGVLTLVETISFVGDLRGIFFDDYNLLHVCDINGNLFVYEYDEDGQLTLYDSLTGLNGPFDGCSYGNLIFLGPTSASIELCKWA